MVSDIEIIPISYHSAYHSQADITIILYAYIIIITFMLNNVPETLEIIYYYYYCEKKSSVVFREINAHYCYYYIIRI